MQITNSGSIFDDIDLSDALETILNDSRVEYQEQTILMLQTFTMAHTDGETVKMCLAMAKKSIDD